MLIFPLYLTQYHAHSPSSAHIHLIWLGYWARILKRMHEPCIRQLIFLGEKKRTHSQRDIEQQQKSDEQDKEKKSLAA